MVPLFVWNKMGF